MPSNHDGSITRSRIVGAAAAVSLWRLAAFVWPSTIVPIPDALRLPYTLLGLVFLASGAAAWWLRPDRWTSVFVLYGIGGGLHWGGTILAAPEGLELGLFFVYLAFSALADAALMHLALTYPSGAALARGARVALYAPAGLALLFAPLAGVLTPSTVQTIAGLVLLVASLLSVAAGIIFIVRLVRADPATRHAARLPLIVGGLVIPTVVGLLGEGGALAGNPEACGI